MRIRDPKTTVLIFVSGKMVVTGSLACTGVGIVFYVFWVGLAGVLG
jgi:TATA-box binding protein (TBP) (component of TFIID and TFIIIB)